MSKISVAVKAAASAAIDMAALTSAQKSSALLRFADLIWAKREFLLRENQKDVRREKRLASAMFARLKLDEPKIRVLCNGIRSIAAGEDPVHKVLQRLELDDGLILEKRTVPIGVIAVIFESRPDVIPQILALFLKSGNVGLLKGGREAIASNRAFMKLVSELGLEFSYLPKAWAQLFLERKDVGEILKFPQYVNLVIPRGSNELVQSIMKATKIPVLGHADGVCHLYWHASVGFADVREVVIDSKTQYPAVCNAVETLLVHQDRVEDLRPLLSELSDLGVEIFGEPSLKKIFSRARRVADWHTEYGDLRLSVRVVKSDRDAIKHINENGSHHTDGILANDKAAIDLFLSTVDSATLTVNASTRFADGYRFGMGAEVGVSTNKTHARGPVGVDGLVIHQYVLRGDGHLVRDYVGSGARPFKHRVL